MILLTIVSILVITYEIVKMIIFVITNMEMIISMITYETVRGRRSLTHR